MVATRLGPLAYRTHYDYDVYTETSRQRIYMAAKAKTAQLNMRISPELKEAAEIAAAADRRTLTSLIEKLLDDYLKDRGYISRDIIRK